MDHVERFHIMRVAPISSSYFYFTRNEVKNVITLTINYPDVVEPHQNDPHKIVFKKDLITRSVATGIVGCLVKRFLQL